MVLTIFDFPSSIWELAIQPHEELIRIHILVQILLIGFLSVFLLFYTLAKCLPYILSTMSSRKGALQVTNIVHVDEFDEFASSVAQPEEPGPSSCQETSSLRPPLGVNAKTNKQIQDLVVKVNELSARIEKQENMITEVLLTVKELKLMFPMISTGVNSKFCKADKLDPMNL